MLGQCVVQVEYGKQRRQRHSVQARLEFKPARPRFHKSRSAIKSAIEQDISKLVLIGAVEKVIGRPPSYQYPRLIGGIRINFVETSMYLPTYNN